MTQAIRAAVLGVGYLGSFHAEKYASLDQVELVGVVDTDIDRARSVADKLGTQAFQDYRELIGRIDCASVAVPTSLHHDIAYDLIQHGVDVLVEKPMAGNVEDGRRLVKSADNKGRILQVGHLERFNPAIRALAKIISEPRFIECHRLAPFVDRGTDVDVILDLMIHDLDVILSIVDAEVERVEGVGIPVFTENIDIANARLRFSNGGIANITASRAAMKTERKIRLFQTDTYVSVDYGEKHVRIIRKKPTDAGPEISVEELSLGESDALFDEIEHFVNAVRTREQPLVDGHAALRALEVADQVRRNLETE